MAEEKQQSEIEPDMEVDEGGEDEEWEDDEVFYERIEAPKFVDFTTPDHYRPDDRYWFCLRVGCDQKHEEEMDHEKIYNDFVLRVMAARSPNVRLQKALSRRATGKNIKCPLTAPAKASKSRLSKLAAVSIISRKLIEDKEKISYPSMPTSTPKIKGKQVAAKYLTTPRNKKCLPNPNSFRSVQNPKPAALAVPKNSRTIAKALVFHSPKKAISLKKSVELRTPLTKISQGIKKLEISDQKKRVLVYSEKSKDIKCNPGDSLRNRNSQKDKSKTPKSTGKSQTRVLSKARPVHSTSIQNQARLEKKCHSKEKAENECSKPEVDLTSRDSNEEHVTASKNHEVDITDNLSCNTDQRGLVGNDLPKIQPTSGEDHCGGNIESTKGNLGTELNKTDHSICLQTSEGAGHHGSECIDTDDKENVSVPDENRSLTNNINQAGENILGVQKMQKLIKKNAQPTAKNLKEGLLSTNAGALVMKSKKPKLTNPKPFRLRTDERGILREADLQRKKQGNVEYSDNENRCTEDNPEDNDRDSKDLRNDLSKDSGNKSHKSSDGKVRLRKSSITQERSHATQIKTTNLRNAKSPVASCLRQLTVIQEASADISKPKKVGKLPENGAPAVSRAKALTPSRMLSRGRRPLTIPKELHFHSTHRPKSCTKNLAEQEPL